MGEWKDGKKHGQGTFTYGKGKWKVEKYVGEFKHGYRNGQGTYTWSDVEKYVEEWKKRKKYGQGTFTYSRGKYVGEFRKGKQFNTTLYDKDENIYGRYVNGVRQ